MPLRKEAGGGFWGRHRPYVSFRFSDFSLIKSQEGDNRSKEYQTCRRSGEVTKSSALSGDHSAAAKVEQRDG